MWGLWSHTKMMWNGIEVKVLNNLWVENTVKWSNDLDEAEKNFSNRNDNIENKTSGNNNALETDSISKWLNNWDLSYCQ